jgi:hypothetical protein
MKNIDKIFEATDSNHNFAGYYKVVFTDQSSEMTGSQMNVKLFNEVQEWLKTHHLDYDIETFCLKIKKEIENKIQENYNKAQIVKVVNGITFEYPIDGTNYSMFKEKVQEAALLGFCNINIKDINGIYYGAKLPYNLILNIFKKTNEIASTNETLKISVEVKLEIHFKNQDIMSMKDLDLNIFEINSEINLNEICDKILKDSPNDEYLNQIKFVEDGKNRYHIFTRII